ncbi:antibiotic biosynthesis monooxygenase family protein [Allorhizobium pseudoryzae]|uniref:antibiotic biosynthesis monooxygenase family protein n=1 Tax=Allorhizobium pseudoryzae TaxID=379684 RepID=UPI003D047745
MPPTSGPFAVLPEPPYYVVTFASERTDGDNGYGAMAEAMVDLARRQPGFLGVESARGADGFGITNSFWQSEEHIRAWKRVVDHLTAQQRGRRDWYRHYAVRIGVIQRAYDFSQESP